MSQVVSELLAFNEGSEFYRYDDPLPDSLTGKTFAEANKWAQSASGTTGTGDTHKSGTPQGGAGGALQISPIDLLKSENKGYDNL